jgi:hypothetical protein
MSLGETCKERSAVLDKDVAPFSSESEAGIYDDDDGGYRWCDLGGGQRAGHGNSTRSQSTGLSSSLSKSDPFPVIVGPIFPILSS